MEKKILKDPLYNYISIDSDIVENIIDTKYFQRLRRIEQTSMRCLYPSARHDRFIHSIGTYYLAKVAVKSLEKNYKNGVGFKIDDEALRHQLPKKKIRKQIQFNFQMAALLHDIGHSPFSHTLEDYFQTIYSKEVDQTIKSHDILEELFVEVKKLITENQEEDYEAFKQECKDAKSAPHEIASCIVILRCFKDTLRKLAEDRGVEIQYCFICRCILGALYSSTTLEEDYRNCIIKLLNSSIDVDKLDYISRDSQVSGFDNVEIDTQRLLNSLVFAVHEDTEGRQRLCLAFRKTALSVIQNVVMSRNSLYTWIYSHHKVKYEGYLIHEAVRLIAKKQEESFGKKDSKLFISELFSVNNIIDRLFCDDTIWNLFMHHIDIPEVCEIIERGAQKKAVWKSFAEFQAYFMNSTSAIGNFSMEQMQYFLEHESKKETEVEAFKKYLNEFDKKKQMKFELVINRTKLCRIEHNTILIYINNQLYGFDSLFSELYKNSNIPLFFYLYCSKETKDLLNANDEKEKKKLIEYIKNYEKFRLEPAKE